MEEESQFLWHSWIQFIRDKGNSFCKFINYLRSKRWTLASAARDKVSLWWVFHPFRTTSPQNKTICLRTTATGGSKKWWNERSSSRRPSFAMLISFCQTLLQWPTRTHATLGLQTRTTTRSGFRSGCSRSWGWDLERECASPWTWGRSNFSVRSRAHPWKKKSSSRVFYFSLCKKTALSSQFDKTITPSNRPWVIKKIQIIFTHTKHNLQLNWPKQSPKSPSFSKRSWITSECSKLAVYCASWKTRRCTSSEF